MGGARISMSSVSQFISEYSAKVLQLTDIFKSLPKDTQRHKTALPGALQIKKAQKTLETLAEAPEEEGFKETLLKCQVVMREVVLGMLDLTFSMEEDLASEDFGNAESVAMVQDHLDDLVGWATRLTQLFAENEVVPKEPAVQSAESLGPEITEMLANAAKNQRGNQKPSAAAANDGLAQLKQQWAESDGRLARLLEAEVWEVVCWRRGSLRHKLASVEMQQPSGGDCEATPSCEILEQSFDAFQKMLRAQGPVAADLEAPDCWQAAHSSEETASLLHHGIYSSTHLLALKQQCEISYWLWKYHPSAERAAVGERTLRQFVFIVEKLIPERGWTAELEKQRAKEVQRAAKALLSADGASGETAGGVSTMEVLEQEFGSMDVQQEIDQMKKEDENDVQKEKKSTKKKKKKK